jgi:ATP-dependent DNA helicase PIF1
MAEEKNDDYMKLFSSVKNSENVFLTGPGGVGKSYYINKLKNELKGTNMCLTSTTGVSAFNLGAQTIHSFSGIGVLNKGDKLDKVIRKIKRSKNFLTVFEKIDKCELLVIDEISMLGKHYLEMIDEVFQHVKKTKKVFGGIQVIFTGDFLQLPPIEDKFCFHSAVWEKLGLKTIYLRKMYRVTDPVYTGMLERIRVAKHTTDDNKILYKRFFAYKEWEQKNHEDEPGVVNESKTLEIMPTFLFSKRVNVHEKNMEELHKNPNELLIFSPKFVPGKYGADYQQYIDMTPLQLKIGAQVMLTVNLDVDGGLVNGSRGVVVDYKDGILHVKFMNGITVGFDRHEYTYTEENENNDKVLYKIVQYPFTLAYALSIHKVQGCTLDYAIIDLGFSVFEASMSYVALSRVRSLEGLLLKSYQPQRIFCHDDALEFYENLDKE